MDRSRSGPEDDRIDAARPAWPRRISRQKGGSLAGHLRAFRDGRNGSGGGDTGMNRRLGLLVGSVAIIAAACSSNSGGSPAASAGAPSAAASAAASAGGSAAAAGSGGAGCTVGVSWNNFQQPRWAAHDKPNIQKTVEAA